MKRFKTDDFRQTNNLMGINELKALASYGSIYTIGLGVVWKKFEGDFKKIERSRSQTFYRKEMGIKFL